MLISKMRSEKWPLDLAIQRSMETLRRTVLGVIEEAWEKEGSRENGRTVTETMNKDNYFRKFAQVKGLAFPGNTGSSTFTVMKGRRSLWAQLQIGGCFVEVLFYCSNFLTKIGCRSHDSEDMLAVWGEKRSKSHLGPRHSTHASQSSSNHINWRLVGCIRSGSP